MFTLLNSILLIMTPKIKAIIGLGNPGAKYSSNRHNIGFMILDELAEACNSNWSKSDNFESAKIEIGDNSILLIKPQTFMNNSGQVVAALKKKGIKPEEILVVHDELELPYGKIALKFAGSAKGHNGLKSIIANTSDQFWRLRFGIGRPLNREDVPNYVLENFRESDLNTKIDESIKNIEALFIKLNMMS